MASAPQIARAHLRSHWRRSGTCLCDRSLFDEIFRSELTGGGRTPGVTAIRALRMQKEQLRVGHTIHPSDSGRQASERPPCCHKEIVPEAGVELDPWPGIDVLQSASAAFDTSRAKKFRIAQPGLRRSPPPAAAAARATSTIRKASTPMTAMTIIASTKIVPLCSKDYLTFPLNRLRY